MIDLFVELPLLIGVVITGAVLLLKTPAIDASLWAKVLLGLGAVALNVGCAFAVILRRRTGKKGGDPSLLTRLVFGSAGLGVPLALIALYLGGERGGWW
jgi:drug/metabolite transporter (DMT)-like permease